MNRIKRTIATLRKRGWVITGPQLDYLDDDPPPFDLPDVPVTGYRVKSPKMSKSYHTARPITLHNMADLEKWSLTPPPPEGSRQSGPGWGY